MAINEIINNLIQTTLKHGKVISLALSGASISILLYYLLRAMSGIDPFYPVGTNMVDREITLIPNLVYMKPITIFVITTYIAYVVGLTTMSNHVVKKWNKKMLDFIDMLALTFAFISGYEILFNFTLWSALISSITINGLPQDNIDLLYNSFPNPDTPWNIVFATKIFTLIFSMCLTTLFFTSKWRRLKKVIQ